MSLRDHVQLAAVGKIHRLQLLDWRAAVGTVRRFGIDVDLVRRAIAALRVEDVLEHQHESCSRGTEPAASMPLSA